MQAALLAQSIVGLLPWIGCMMLRDCVHDRRIIAQSSDPRFAQQNLMVKIRTLRITYMQYKYTYVLYKITLFFKVISNI